MTFSHFMYYPSYYWIYPYPYDFNYYYRRLNEYDSREKKYKRGRLKTIIFEMEYPDGDSKCVGVTDAHDISYIIFDGKYIPPQDKKLFNVSKDKWDENPAMIIYGRDEGRVNDDSKTRQIGPIAPPIPYPIGPIPYPMGPIGPIGPIGPDPIGPISDQGRPNPRPFCTKRKCGAFPIPPYLLPKQLGINMQDAVIYPYQNL